ncbi:MAG: ABC transporter permease [Bacteroidales bacterium]
MKHILKQVIRTFQKNLGQSLLKVTGWTIALTSCLLIFLFVLYHYNFDKHYQDYERIYRLQQNRTFKGVYEPSFYVRPQIGPNLAKDIPELGTYCRVSYPRNIPIRVNTSQIMAQLNFVDNSYFDVFDQPLESNISKKNILKEPYTVVLDREYAHTLFGNENPLGKIIHCPDFYKMDLKVTGIIDIPKSTHLPMQMLVSNATMIPKLPKIFPEGWIGGPEYFTYFKLPDNITKEQVEQKFPDWFKTNINDHISDDIFYDGYLMSLEDLHLRSEIKKDYSLMKAFSEEYIFFFIFIALLILFIASVNYVNLTTADLYSRAKNFGIIKVLGAESKEIQKILYVESAVILGISFLFSIILAEILIPVFNRLVDVQFEVYSLHSLFVLVSMFFLCFLVSIITNILPIRLVKRLNPQKIIKGIYEVKSKKNFSRFLLVLQFFIASILITITIVLQQQFSFLNSMDYGFKKDDIMILSLKNKSALINSEEIVRKIKELPEVENAVLSTTCPGKHFYGDIIQWKKEPFDISVLEVSSGYYKLFDLHLKEGRFPDQADYAVSDSLIVINETMARKVMGVSNNPIIGTELNLFGRRKFSVVGVVDDIKFCPGKDNNVPLVIFQKFWRKYSNSKDLINVRLRENVDYKEAMSKLDNVIESISADAIYESSSLNNIIMQSYRVESMIYKIISIFTILAIVVAGLGLLGLSSFFLRREMKSIGIRKLLGAKTSTILYKNIFVYVRMVFIANILSLPIAYFLLKIWLDSFVDHITLSFFYFLFSFCMTLIIAVSLIFYKAFKASRMKAIDIVNYE